MPGAPWHGLLYRCFHVLLRRSAPAVHPSAVAAGLLASVVMQKRRCCAGARSSRFCRRLRAGAPVRELSGDDVTTTVALVKTREAGWPLLFVSDGFAEVTGARLCTPSATDSPAAGCVRC